MKWYMWCGWGAGMTDIDAGKGPTHRVPYGDGQLPFLWRRDLESNCRRRARICVHPNGLVEVQTPSDVTLVEAKRALLKRAHWVTRHLREIEARRADLLAREYVSGETHFYLGRRHPLKIIPGDRKPEVKLLRGKLCVTTPDTSEATIKRALEEWYREHARALFARRLEAVADRLAWVRKTPPCAIRNMKTQWGSCSPSGTILLNPYLVKTPVRCIDYVILHELCHIKEHNHGVRFYQLLTTAMPDWKRIKGNLDAMSEMYLNI